MTAGEIICDGEELPVQVQGRSWISSWHPAAQPPNGTPHGSAGVCITASGALVLISADGIQWDLPAGRTEPGETWEETLRREVREEACAVVTNAQLLGFSRGICVSGPEVGLVLVRSFWQAQVVLGPWQPQFEIAHRRLIAPAEALAQLPPALMPFYKRAFAEAGLLNPRQHMVGG
jgi:ADP-ribose pyrophosphatase YjhB (NUDIX family)